ncbi:hypothetical protein ACWDYJ_03250 [Streptomyces sp. NPDC003042]
MLGLGLSSSSYAAPAAATAAAASPSKDDGKGAFVSLRGTRMYGDGYAVAVEPAESAAIALAAQQDRWAEAVAANVPQSPCDDVTGDPA